MMRVTALALCCCFMVALGCASRNPEWAESINPCCGQDEMLAGEEPSENRCADMVLSREAALALSLGAAAGSGMTQWRVRFIPGGPACIWRKWPGLTDEDYLHAEEPGGDAAVDTLRSEPGGDGAPADTLRPAPGDSGSAGAFETPD